MPFSDLTAPTAALRICVDKAEPGRLSGLVYSQRLTAPLSFFDLGALLLRLDEVMDKQNFPQAFQRSRSFSTKESGVPAAHVPEDGLAGHAVAEAKGVLATFDLYITSRRNSSWQGYINWLDGKEATPFASALEVMWLIEGKLLG